MLDGDISDHLWGIENELCQISRLCVRSNLWKILGRASTEAIENERTSTQRFANSNYLNYAERHSKKSWLSVWRLSRWPISNEEENYACMYLDVWCLLQERKWQVVGMMLALNTLKVSYLDQPKLRSFLHMCVKLLICTNFCRLQWWSPKFINSAKVCKSWVGKPFTFAGYLHIHKTRGQSNSRCICMTLQQSPVEC